MRDADDVEASLLSTLERREQQRATRRRCSRPAVTTTLLPKRCTHTLDSGAKIISTAACGSSTAPALTVE